MCTAQLVKQDSAHCDMNINIYFGLVIRSRKRENVFWIPKVPLRFEMNNFSGFKVN